MYEFYFYLDVVGEWESTFGSFYNLSTEGELLVLFSYSLIWLKFLVGDISFFKWGIDLLEDSVGDNEEGFFFKEDKNKFFFFFVLVDYSSILIIDLTFLFSAFWVVIAASDPDSISKLSI